MPAFAHVLEQLLRDLRQGARMIARMPVLATVVILSLGIGIGVNTAIFSWLQVLVFKPLPGVRAARELHSVSIAATASPHGGGGLHGGRGQATSYPGASWLEYQDLRVRLTSFEDLIAYRMVPLSAGESGRTERVYAQLVSANYFSALGLRPELGQLVLRDDAQPVVIVSWGFWQTRLGGAADVIGQRVRLNDRELTVIGVAPERFQGTVMGLDFDLWVPASLARLLLGSSEVDERSLRGVSVLGRLRAGVTLEQAQAEADAAMLQLAHLQRTTNAGIHAELFPFWQSPQGPQRMLQRALSILQGIMLVLLLAVTANTANLMLARASTRQREAAVRSALGAGRWRITSLLLAENLVLAGAGAALGVLVAIWGTNALRAAPMITAFPIRFQTGVDLTGLAFALLLGLLCGIVFGLAPAFQLSRINAESVLRAGFSTAGRHRMRGAIMGSEVALALVVLVAAALFFRSFRETQDTNPGFQKEGVLLASYDLGGRNLNDGAVRAFTSSLLARLRALPGVEAAGIATSVPLDIHGLPVRTFALEGRAVNVDAPDQALSNTVTPGYLAAMGIPLRRGSDFAQLTDEGAPKQAIVNEEFARRYGVAADVLGRRIEVRGASYLIVGVSANSLYNTFGEPPTPIIYLSYRDRLPYSGELHLRTRPGMELPLAPEVRRVVRELAATLPIHDVRTLHDHVEKNLFLRRIPARMFVVLGPLLLLLAAIGIYAVVSYNVTRRTAEIGLRLALGATPRRIAFHIVRESFRPIATGAAIGWVVAFMVYIHVAAGKPLDPNVFVGMPALLLLVATLASWLPARRATRLDPRTALSIE